MRVTATQQFQNLSAALNSRATALGTLFLLSEAGSLNGNLEYLADWRQEPGALIKILLDTGYLTQDGDGYALTISMPKAQPRSTAPRTAPSAFGPRALMALYNAHRGRMQECRQLTAQRERAAALRCHDYPDPAQWIEVIEYCAATPFYCGKNDRGWTGSIDYFLRPDTFVKVLERMQNKVLPFHTDGDNSANRTWLEKHGWLSEGEGE